jgi:hypothetical protein
MILELEDDLRFNVSLSEYEISSLFGITDIYIKQKEKEKSSFLVEVAKEIKGGLLEYLQYIQTTPEKIAKGEERKRLAERKGKIIQLHPKHKNELKTTENDYKTTVKKQNTNPKRCRQTKDDTKTSQK